MILRQVATPHRGRGPKLSWEKKKSNFVSDSTVALCRWVKCCHLDFCFFLLFIGHLIFLAVGWLVGRLVGRLAGGYTTCPHVVGEDGCSLVLLRRCCVLLVQCFVFVLFFSSGEMPACYFRLSPCSVLRPGIHPSIHPLVRPFVFHLSVRLF